MSRSVVLTEGSTLPIGPADPVEAIQFRMEQQGLTPRDLETYIGSSGRVSEVLNRKRPLSLRNPLRESVEQSCVILCNVEAGGDSDQSIPRPPWIDSARIAGHGRFLDSR